MAAEADLRQSLLLNPAIQALKIAVRALWIRKLENITGTHTSAVITFEDPDGTVERKLMKLALFVFGEKITVKKWLEKPPAKKTVVVQ